MAADSQVNLRRSQHRDRFEGNIVPVETQHGQRLQKFSYKGMGPVTKRGVWPKTAKSPL